MPKMDGWAVLHGAEGGSGAGEIPVIMVTIVDDQNLGYTLGAADYLTKPIDRERLLRGPQKLPLPGAAVSVLLIEDDDVDARHDADACSSARLAGDGGGERTGGPRARVGAPPDADPAGPDDAGDGRLRVSGATPLATGTASVPVVVITAKDLTRGRPRAADGVGAEDPAEGRVFEGGFVEEGPGAGDRVY